ncbi:hypothetical protein KM043_008010 [Ampulex compressa]|nr:hypothetical protein KM043_008010 [Ampulex compressa]
MTDTDRIENEDKAYLMLEERIRSEGYIGEKHTVQTEDGYLLTIHRVSRGCDAPIVFLLHGAYSSASIWFSLGRNNSLAYVLADEGFDVWLGNLRGNVFSKAHVTLDPSENEFWNFSWHESGIYDLPAMLSYITSFCDKEVEAVINYSMGGTAFFVMASERPEALRMIRNAYNISPLVYSEYSKDVMPKMCLVINAIVTRSMEVLTQSELLIQFLRLVCTMSWIEHDICFNLIFMLFGPSGDNVNKVIFNQLAVEYPRGGSGGQILHYCQIFESGEFRKYDFGMAQNLEVYGDVLPPEYHFSNYMTPTVIFTGNKDYLVNPKDLDKLVTNLNRTTMCILKDYNHIDFLFGENKFHKNFNHILQFLKKNQLEEEQDKYGQCHG